jgi:hypothetical protein
MAEADCESVLIISVIYRYESGDKFPSSTQTLPSKIIATVRSVRGAAPNSLSREQDEARSMNESN